jgi:hypothetical protein
MSLEYLVTIVIIIIIVRGPKPRPPPGDPQLQEQFIGNVHLVGAAGLIVTTIATNPEEAFSLRYGPFMLLPAIQVLVGLYYNNTSVPAARKVKM